MKSLCQNYGPYIETGPSIHEQSWDFIHIRCICSIILTMKKKCAYTAIRIPCYPHKMPHECTIYICIYIYICDQIYTLSCCTLFSSCFIVALSGAIGLLPDTQNCGLCMRRECLGTFFPPTRVSDPDMHHGTCVAHVP